MVIAFSDLSAAGNGAKDDIQKLDLKREIKLESPLKQCFFYGNTNKTFNQPVNEKYASDNNKQLYIYSDDGNLKNIDLEGGEIGWTSRLGSKIVSNFVFNADSLFFVIKSNDEYYLKKVTGLTGITIWQTKLDLRSTADTGDTDRTLAELNGEKDDNFFLAVQNDKLTVLGLGKVIQVDAQTGLELANRTIEDSFVNLPYVSDARIFFAGSRGLISVLSLSELNVKRTVSDQLLSALSADGDVIVYGNKKGLITAINLRQNRKVWTFRAGAEITDLKRTDFGLLVTSSDNYMYLLTNKSGKLKWKIRTPGRIASKPLVADKYVIFVNRFQPESYIVNLAAGKIVNRLALEDDNYFFGDVFFAGGFPLFATLKGLITFREVCGETQKETKRGEI